MASENDDKAGSMIDSLFDTFDKVVGGAEAVFARPEALWVYDEVIDGDDGTRSHEVVGPGGKLEASSAELGKRVCALLNGEKP